MDTALRQKPKITVNLDTRNAFITNGRVKFTGIKAGLDFGKTIKFGAGYHFLQTPIYRDTLQFRVAYVALYGEYIFLKSKRWEFSLPVQLGAGNSSYEYTDNTTGLKNRINEKMIVLYEPALAAQYKFFKWLGFGMGMGYRIMLVNNKAIDEKMTSPIYVFHLKVFPGVIIRGIFGKKKEKGKK
ncbi:MAG: hypothetical protein HYY40_06520 [Bacteroidetes bacterium]|nr:hypothetical protein [Bacteroidota bacterium]